MSIRSILLLGLLLGMRHAAEPDHLAAVVSMSAGVRDRLSTVIRGATWGLGHTIALLAMGALTIGLGFAVPRTSWFERGVGVMLIGLGCNVLFRMRRQRIHVHVHRHDDGMVHVHAHRHDPEDVHAELHPNTHHRAFDLRAACVGMVHGLAGSAALLLAMASALTPRWLALMYLGVFGVGSIAGMALLSAAIAVPLDLSARRLTRAYATIEWLIAVSTIGIGISLMR
jgi:ABC-type nickel/cobalt efflux system permease component RcnA